MANRRRTIEINKQILEQIIEDPAPKLRPNIYSSFAANADEEIFEQLRLRPNFALIPQPEQFVFHPAPKPEPTHEDQFFELPIFSKHQTITLQYSGLQLTQQAENELTTKIHAHLSAAYKQAAEQLGMVVEQRSDGELLITLNGKPLNHSQRLNLENTMQTCFNQLAQSDHLKLIYNGYSGFLTKQLELTQELELQQSQTLHSAPQISPFRTRCTPPGTIN